MPRRLDPEKGLPGLFQPNKAPSGDMGFLVRKTDASKTEAKPKPRRRSSSPKVAPLAAPATTISQISGRHARPTVTSTPQPNRETPASAPAVESVSTAASDVASSTTATSSAAFQRPVVIAVVSIDPETERVLRDAPPVCRVPTRIPPPPALAFADFATLGPCVAGWVSFALRGVLGLV